MAKKKRASRYIKKAIPITLTEKEKKELKKQQKKELNKEFKDKARARREVAKTEKKEPLLTRIKKYFIGVRTEVKKVVWPTRKETTTYTITVLVACAFFGLFFWLIDTGLLSIMTGIFKIETTG
ncbi:MAG: preprotein translocase subunit SecE [Clostridiales Family XIII bacterium]|jgi:preprotein translocase subunit SecE|nr:preprotein translocase subunit SecE [Clostridiales Family XIII bacterium]